MNSSLDVIELTRALVAIDSVNPFSTVETEERTIGIGNEGEIHLYIEQLLQERGFSVERQVVEEAQEVQVDGQLTAVPARWNLLAEKGSGARSVLFVGHADTVDVKPGWQSDPFVATEKTVQGQQRLYGLGCNDMKSGIAAIISGIPDRLPEGHKIKIALVVDEEFWSFGATRLLNSDFLDDVVLALSPELGECGPDAQAQQVGLGRLGRDEFEFQITGKACHGADALISEEAVNAVHQSIHLQSALIEYCTKAKRSFEAEGISVVNSAYINLHSGGRGMLSVPDSARFVLDRSFVLGETAEDELKKLEHLVLEEQQHARVDPRATITVRRRPRPTAACDPFFIPAHAPKVQALEACIRSLGHEVRYFIGRSVADENRLAARGIPTLILGPTGVGAHTAEEWVSVDSVRRLSEIIAALCQTPALFVEDRE